MRKEEDSNKFKEEKEEEEEIDKTFIQLTNDEDEKNKVKQKEKIEKEKKEAEDKKEREAKESEKINKESDYENSREKKLMEGKFELNGKNIIKIPNFPQPEMQYAKFDRTLFRIMLSIVIVWFSLLIIVNIGVSIAHSIKKKNMRGINFHNNEIDVLNSLDILVFSKLKDDILIAFSIDGVINLSQFYEENLNQKPYKGPDPNLNNIHISIGYSDTYIDDVITHLSSIVEHMASTTFLHIHIMNCDNFTLETFAKIMNMVHKINNNTEIIMYNAFEYVDDFKIRKDKNEPHFYKEYARLYAFQYIKNVSKLIMLNLDNIMIEKDLSELYNLDVSDIYARGVPTMLKNELITAYIKDKNKFIDGDVILVNLDLCRKELFFNKSLDINNKKKLYMKTEAPAQDIFNILMNKKIEFLHPKFNKINFYEKEEDKYDESKWYPWFSEMLKYGNKNNNFYKKEDLLNADNDPIIVNYCFENQLGKKVKKYEDEKVKYAKINDFIK